MSGDTFKPEEGGEVEVINPDAGNNEIDAQPEAGDPFDAAELQALEELERTSEDDTAPEPEVEPEQVTEDLQAGQDQTEPEPEDEQEAEQPQTGWDGNPANLPEELKATYKSMERGFHQKMREVADERKKLEELQSQMLLRLSDEKSAPADADTGPPPMPTGPDVTWEDIGSWMSEQNKYYAEQNRKAVLTELEQSGKFAPADQLAHMQQQAAVAQTEAEIRGLPGFSEEVESLMLKTASESQFWANAMTTHDGALELARRSIDAVKSASAMRAQADKVAAKTKKQATAASRATPRVTSPKGASPEDVFAKEGFKNEDEKMAYAEKMVLEELGG